MDNDTVTVGKFRFVYEAELARLHLEEAGIRAFTPDAEVINTLLGYGLGDVKLQVARDDAAAAQEVLSQKLPVSSSARDVEEQTACLACGTDIAAGETKCPACGWSYGDDADEN